MPRFENTTLSSEFQTNIFSRALDVQNPFEIAASTARKVTPGIKSCFKQKNIVSLLGHSYQNGSQVRRKYRIISGAIVFARAIIIGALETKADIHSLVLEVSNLSDCPVPLATSLT